MKPKLSSMLLSGLISLVNTYAHPMQRGRGVITLPLRRHEPAGIHPELRHQQQINRADRLLARSFGQAGPSDEKMRRNLERTLSDLRARGEISSDQPLYTIAGMALGYDPLIIERNGVVGNKTTLANSSLVLNTDGSDTQYLATIPIGTPQRNFNIIVDSGSGVFWVGSNICQFDGGGPCESSTFVNSKIPWHATYGSGNASGEVVRDNVIVAGMQLTNFSFGVANVLSSEFTTDGNIDGLMGLARSSITSLKLPTPVEEMARRGLIPAAITSYRLPRRTDSINDGEISFGGLDESRINASELITVPSAEPGFWIAEMGPVTVNGEDIGLTGRSALLDTGTTLMAASADDVQAIHNKIPGAKQSAQGYTVPCNTTAVLALTFGGRSFPINTQELARGSATQRTGDCGSGISVSAQAANRWLVGDTFLKSVYFSTNGDTNKISLAMLR